MKKGIALVAVIAALAGACKKEDSAKPSTTSTSTTTTTTTTTTTGGTSTGTGGTTAPKTTGTVRFVNRSSNPYRLYINDKAQADLAGGKSVEITNVPEGYLTCKVEQLSGYALYPTIEDYTGRLVAGGTLEVIFPK